MAGKLIPCPECKGKKKVWYEGWNCGGMGAVEPCRSCRGTAEINDRRVRKERRSGVVVIPAEKWRRLTELVTRTFPACPCDGNCCESCREDAEIDAILSSVEVQP